MAFVSMWTSLALQSNEARSEGARCIKKAVCLQRPGNHSPPTVFSSHCGLLATVPEDPLPNHVCVVCVCVFVCSVKRHIFLHGCVLRWAPFLGRCVLLECSVKFPPHLFLFKEQKRKHWSILLSFSLAGRKRLGTLAGQLEAFHHAYCFNVGVDVAYGEVTPTCQDRCLSALLILLSLRVHLWGVQKVRLNNTYVSVVWLTNRFQRQKNKNKINKVTRLSICMWVNM